LPEVPVRGDQALTRKMPKQKPHRSKQVVGTPRNFLDAVEKRFGPIVVDLAATKRNRVVMRWIGPGSKECRDFFSPALPLILMRLGGLMWLNPPYSNIGKWAAHARQLARLAGVKIAFLVPASVGSNWFANDIFAGGLALFLSPRLKFVGHKAGYPKDLMLVIFGERPAIRLWRWDEE
jgi:hypothetical protein